MTAYDLLRAAVARDAARPLITYYDDATGERVELSVATFDNWVAKTANLLQDGLSLEPGERVGVALPPHWQAPVVFMACWAVGGVVVPVDADRPADELAAAFAAPDALAGITAHEVVGLSLRPFAGPLADPPPGVLDYAVEVPAYADRFAPYTPVTDDDQAVELAGEALTHGELVERAGAFAARQGWDAGLRVLTTRPLDDLDGLAAGLLAPLLLGGSVVLCRNADEAALPARRTTERVGAEFH